MKSWICGSVLFFLTLFSLIGQSGTARADLWAEYTAAVVDAMEEGNPDKISRDLVPIAPYNDDLVWKNQTSDERQVLMATWGGSFYPDYYQPGDDFTVDTDHLVWVTPVPELKNWLREHPEAYGNFKLRLEQLYGFPPNHGGVVFVEFWVRPDQMLRPSPDPAVSDMESELDYPEGKSFTIDTDYRTWFDNRKATIYDGGSTDGWPWSRLGYTYDWGDQSDHRGLSEFIIWAGETVRIHSITPNAVYVGTVPEVLNGGDYDGDGTSDIAVFRGSSGLWLVRGVTRVYFGASGDLPVPGDYDGDGTTEIGVFKPGSGLWAVRGGTRAYYGSFFDTPVPADYDGDGLCDIGLFNPESGLWAVKDITRVYFGSSGDRPVPGVYGGGAASDIAVFRESAGLWVVRGKSRFYFGEDGDQPVPGDYNGDGTWEAGVFRPEDGLWFVRDITGFTFGGSTVQPLLADLDGNSTEDATTWQGSLGLWEIREISRIYFGEFGDIPVTR